MRAGKAWILRFGIWRAVSVLDIHMRNKYGFPEYFLIYRSPSSPGGRGYQLIAYEENGILVFTNRVRIQKDRPQ